MEITKMKQAFSFTTIYEDMVSLNWKQLLFLSSMLIVMVGLSLYWGDNWIGITAGITGVICVFLVNMRKLSNFFWGFINCTLYGYVAYTASYYGDTMLNWLFYLPVQLIGAYMWSNMMNEGNVESRKITSVKTLGLLFTGVVVIVLVYSQALLSLGGSLSGVDATTTTLSILATFFMVKGYREQWLCWIVVNVLSIYMWTVNFLGTGEGYGVLIMWVMFLANSLYGTYTWFKASKQRE